MWVSFLCLLRENGWRCAVEKEVELLWRRVGVSCVCGAFYLALFLQYKAQCALRVRELFNFLCFGRLRGVRQMGAC